MASILILVGTESGNAQMVADTLQEELGRAGHEVELRSEGDSLAEIGDGRPVLICTATHGLGELPDNIIPLHDALARDRPDLSTVRYGVIALGDQTYHETFCNGGKTMDRLFAELGATRVGERLEIDACTQPLPDEDAVEWAREWVTLL
jgi:MioC protein